MAQGVLSTSRMQVEVHVITPSSRSPGRYEYRMGLRTGSLGYERLVGDRSSIPSRYSGSPP